MILPFMTSSIITHHDITLKITEIRFILDDSPKDGPSKMKMKHDFGRGSW